MSDATPRPAHEVIADHLARRDAGDLEADLAANYRDDVVMLSEHGVETGFAGMRASAERLFASLGPSVFHYEQVLVEGRFGFLRWSAESATHRIRDGADSFVVEDGRIVMQSVHYTVEPR